MVIGIIAMYPVKEKSRLKQIEKRWMGVGKAASKLFPCKWQSLDIEPRRIHKYLKLCPLFSFTTRREKNWQNKGTNERKNEWEREVRERWEGDGWELGRRRQWIKLCAAICLAFMFVRVSERTLHGCQTPTPPPTPTPQQGGGWARLPPLS